ncbi:MAG: response regulator [Chloroflexota bacterium]
MNGRPITLLAEGNTDHAKTIAQAMIAQGLPQPSHVRTGEEAVSWAGMHQFDICVLDYTLRGIDGMETMLRVHQRRPDVPVIMLSSLKSEQVAVTAFRGGVRDFVPLTSGYADTLVEIIIKIARTLTAGSQAVYAGPTALSPSHLRPTYENRLRAIGRQLDIYGYGAINLSEVGGGFLVRALPHGGRSAEALEFLDRDAAQVLSSAVSARGEGERSRPTDVLLPTGYEDFLRALGHRLDIGNMEAVTVTELEPLIVVGGIAPLEIGADTALSPFYELLQSEHIKYLLDEAFRRRTTQRAGIARLLGGN